MSNPRKLPKWVQQVGDRYRFQRRVKDERGLPLDIIGPLEHETPEAAHEAAVLAKRIYDDTGVVVSTQRAITHYQRTGKTPTDLASEQEAEPIPIREVMNEHLHSLEQQAPEELETYIEWCRKAGVLIQTAGTPEDPTFGRLAVDWVFQDISGNCEKRTQADYRALLVNHVLETLGPMPVSTISRRTIKDLLLSKKARGKIIEDPNGRITNKGLSRSKVNHIKAVVSGPLNRAVEADIILANPAHGLRGIFKRGEAKPNAIKPFTRKQIQKLLTTAARDFKSSYPFILCLARTGMRWGEAIELRWDDIDLEARLVHIQRAYSGGEVKTPKSGKPRKVDLSLQLTEALADLQIQRKKQALANGWRSVPELIFVNSTGGRLDHSHFMRDVWRPLLEAAKLEPRGIHNLRHSWISIRLAKGDDPALVSDQAGHYSVDFTLRVYCHYLPSRHSKSTIDELDDPVLAPAAW